MSAGQCFCQVKVRIMQHKQAQQRLHTSAHLCRLETAVQDPTDKNGEEYGT